MRWPPPVGGDYTRGYAPTTSRRAVIAEPNDVPILVAQNGALQGSHWRLDSETLMIGRGSDCDIVIADRQISRYHARIRRAPEGFLLEDLGSKNGTHLNGASVRDSRRPAGRRRHPGGVRPGAGLCRARGHDAARSGERMRDRRDCGWTRSRIGCGLASGSWSRRSRRRSIDFWTCCTAGGSRVVARSDIVQTVWPDEEGEGVSEQAVDALIRRLRDRLAELEPDHGFIVTVRGHGFRLDNPPG